MSKPQSKILESSTNEIDNKMKTYNIALFRIHEKNGYWQKVAQVSSENKLILIDQKTRLGALQLLAYHESRILTLIMDTESQDNVNQEILNFLESKSDSEFIQSYLIDSMQFRRGTVYIMIQSSNRGVRIISYATDKIHHSASCFFTSPLTDVNQTELEERIWKAIQNLEKNSNSYILKSKVIKIIQSGNFLFHC